MRARRREINIFNMSLLDILCGALGAFCFMMLVALPYYIPPGSGLELRKAQEETAQLMRDLEKMKERLPDQKSIDEMEALLRRLEAQVKALQGQVNILTAEKEELQRQTTQLTAEKNELTQQNQLLRAKNDELGKENGQLKAQLAQKQPLTFIARADDAAQSIDLVTMTKTQVENSPSSLFQGWLDGQFDSFRELPLALLRARGIALAVISERPPGAQWKLYIRFTSPAAIQRATVVQCTMFGDFRIDAPSKIGRATLEPGRPWALLGTLAIDKNFRPSFQEATAGERDAEWLRLTGTTPTPTPSPSPTPTEAERAAAEKSRAAYEAMRRKLQETHKKVSRLMQLPPDDSGKNDAEILQLTEEILRDLPAARWPAARGPVPPRPRPRDEGSPRKSVAPA